MNIPAPAASRRRTASARLKIAELADPAQYALGTFDTDRLPWPGRHVSVSGTDLFVRHTPAAASPATPPPGASPPRASAQRTPSPDGAEVALYIHGLGGASTNFTDLAAVLAPWFEGHAIDLPGFGRSGPAAGGDYSIAAHAGLIIEYLERHVGRAIHLVGNSMGGAIAILVASQRPDLIRTLTLVSPAVPDLRLRRGDALLPLVMIPGLGSRVLRRMDRLDAEHRARMIIELCFAHPERVPENRLAEATEDVLARRELPWAHDAFISSLRGLVRTYLMPRAGSPWQAMRLITSPTLIIWGALDELVDVSNAPRVASTIADSSLLVLPDIGHTAQLEDPVMTARAILALRERANERPGQARVGV
jgi:pimeloyl-ACP methyl ester carboxylesterase